MENLIVWNRYTVLLYCYKNLNFPPFAILQDKCESPKHKDLIVRNHLHKILIFIIIYKIKKE